MNEARTAAGLHHTHIVPVFDVGQVGGLCYYAMQRIEGCGLDRVLKRMRRDRSTAAGSTHPSLPKPSSRPRLAESDPNWSNGSSSSRGGLLVESGGLLVPPHDEDTAPFEPPRGSAYYRWVAATGRQAAEALNHAHLAGVIHRDVKPSNLLVDAKGMVWVADFGLARRLADPSQTQADSLLGTPRYMSPEQAKTGPIDGRTDVYSLGATLYELLTLHPPFDGQSAAELIEQIRLKEVLPPRKRDSRIPRDVETIVLKCLSKRPADRYETAAELAADLGRFLAMEPVRARRIGPIGRAWRFARRHPAVAGVSTVATVVVLSTATYAYVRIVEERDLAVAARIETQKQHDRALHAGAETKAAMATLVRFSYETDRRASGLALLKDAAEHASPHSTLRARLRDEAIEFLALRDVISQPAVASGPTRGVVFGPDNRLATLAEDGRSISLWDLAHGGRLVRTRDLPGAAEQKVAQRSQGRVPQWNRLSQLPSLTLTGPYTAAAIWSNGHGLRIFDLAACDPTGDEDISIPDRQVLAVYGAAAGGRLVTIERLGDRGGFGPPPPEGNPLIAPNLRSRPRRDRDQYVINLWDPSAPKTAPIALEFENEAAEDLRANPIPLVAISPDGELVATSLRFGEDVTLWSARDGSKRKTLETQPDLTSLVFGPNGLLAAAGSGSIRLWDTRSMAPLPGVTPRQPFVRRLTFSPDGGLLAVGGFSQDVEIWDPMANALVAMLKASEIVADLTFAPTGRTLAVAGSAPALPLWEIVEPAARIRLGGFAQAPTSLAFSTKGLLAVASKEAPPRLWRSDDNPGTRSVPGVGSPSALSFEPDTGQLVTFDNNTLTLRWCNPNSLESATTELRLPKHPGRSFGGEPMAWSADGKTLILAWADEIYLWSATSPERLQRIADPVEEKGAPSRNSSGPRGGQNRGGPPKIWRQVALDPAGKRLYLAGAMPGDLHVWELEGSQAREITWPALVEDVLGLALSDDGQMLALIDRTGVVTLVDPVLKEIITKLVPPGSNDVQASVVAFAPGGAELAVGTRQGVILVWTLGESTEPALTLRLSSHRGFVTTLAYDPQGHRLASGGSDKMVDIWDIGQMRAELAMIGLGW